MPLCTVASSITYRVYRKLIKNVKDYMKVKILFVRMQCETNLYTGMCVYSIRKVLKICPVLWSQ